MSRFIVTADWENNAPHLNEQVRADLWASIPAYQRDARTKGIPQLGAGIIFPIPEDDIVCDPVKIPPHWFRGYSLDVGWNRTAAMFRAKDPDSGISYFYAEYYRGEENPVIHAAALKHLCAQRSDGRPAGPWIAGKIDPAARGRNQHDGEKLLKMYRGLIYGTEDPMIGEQMLTPANNAVETGIYDTLMALSEGRLKVFRTCKNWLAERRLYRRDEKGRIIKKNDHAMDAGRYNVASGDAWLLQEPALLSTLDDPAMRFGGGSAAGAGWMMG